MTSRSEAIAVDEHRPGIAGLAGKDTCFFKIFIFLIKLYFEIIVDFSHIVVRSSAEAFPVPFALFPPMVMSCKTGTISQPEY